MNPITIEGSYIIFRKPLFSADDIELARCLHFEVEVDKIVCDMRVTTRRALFEFLRLVYNTYMTNEIWKSFREDIFKKIKRSYDELWKDFRSSALKNAGYKRKLFAHQEEAIFIAAYKQYNLFALEPGLGKTVTAATISKIFHIRRTIVICPSVAKWNWYNDLTQGWGYNEMYFTILDSQKRNQIQALSERFVIVNYEMVAKKMVELCKDEVGHIIIDESHRVKNPSTALWKATKALIDKYPAARVTLLTGTPVKNRVNDLFGYLKLTNHYMGRNYSSFLKRFTYTSMAFGGKPQVTGGKNLEELFIKTSNFMLRKTKEECLDLPPITYSKCYFDLEDYQDEYNAVIEEMVNHPEGDKLNSSIHTLNIVAAKSKIKGIIDLADGILENGKKVIIFASYKDPLNMLKSHYGNKCVKIDGSVSSFDRNALVQRFLTDPECTVFLGNHQAAGVAINLVNCHNVIHCNFPMTPAELQQSNDRTHRIGQKSNVTVYYTIARDTIDEDMFMLNADKQTDINAVVDRGKEVLDYRNIPDLLFKNIIAKYKSLKTA